MQTRGYAGLTRTVFAIASAIAASWSLMCRTVQVMVVTTALSKPGGRMA